MLQLFADAWEIVTIGLLAAALIGAIDLGLCTEEHDDESDDEEHPEDHDWHWDERRIGQDEVRR